MTNRSNIHSLPGPAGERALVARLLAGETPACRELYETHAPRLLRLLVRFLRGDRAAAEDVLQQTFIAAFRALGEKQEPASLGAWLTSIAVRLALNALRSERRRNAKSLMHVEEPAGHPVAELADRATARRLLELIDGLDEPKRTTMLLFGEGHTAAEIADVLDEPRGTVLARISRTRAELSAQALAEGLIDLERAVERGAR